MLYVPVVNFVDADFAAVRAMLVHPLTVPGLGDAGAHCTMICDASFPDLPAVVLGPGRAPEQRLPLEWVIKSQCADTAALVGLMDRGVLAAGYRADVNVIDLDGLGYRRPRDALRPPRQRQAAGAAGERLRGHAWWRAKSSPGTARRRAPCPVPSCGGRSRPRTASTRPRP